MNYSSVKKACKSRDKPVLHLHITENLVKEKCSPLGTLNLLKKRKEKKKNNSLIGKNMICAPTRWAISHNVQDEIRSWRPKKLSIADKLCM